MPWRSRQTGISRDPLFVASARGTHSVTATRLYHSTSLRRVTLPARAFASAFDPFQEARIVQEPMLEPVVLRLEADDDAGRLPWRV